MGTEYCLFGGYSEIFTRVQEQDLPSIQTATFLPSPHIQKEKILHYLNSGRLIHALHGRHPIDPFTTPPIRLADRNLRTDEVWIWPTSVIHFVAAYDMLVPQAFVEHMQNSNWEIPVTASDISASDDVSVPSIGRREWPAICLSVSLATDYEKCDSILKVWEISRVRLPQLLTDLNIENMGGQDRLRLSGAMCESLVPPKFIGKDGEERIASKDEIDASTGALAFLFANDRQLPLSWTDQSVVWLDDSDGAWTVLIDGWQNVLRS